ncbi:MAG: hypothetical protein KIT16_14135 [Rhodospirillaceae bacterium]|nr:hypothetical protein [Rhodospirillaceae bacterium]
MIPRIISIATKVFFAIAAAMLCLLSVCMVGAALWDLLRDVQAGDGLLGPTLRAIGLVTIAVAVFDVGIFFAEEELVRVRELRSVVEARRSLTKFMSIIIIAVCLEAIVIVLETKAERTDQILYPTLLLLVAVFAVVALGVFQRLSRDSAAAGQVRKRDSEVQAEAQAED